MASKELVIRSEKDEPFNHRTSQSIAIQPLEIERTAAMFLGWISVDLTPNQLMVPKCQTGQEKSKWRGLGRAVTGGLNSNSKVNSRNEI
ncbi:hypothetical protein MKX08_004972 [Trichoderma sp. CBMAI-0020]|nr:hypothetical protein MKX08_004972 [Trichoderma sp. CBMAI-0020]